MNSRQRAVLARIFAEPTPADLRWSEIEGVFRAMNAEITEGAGSRIRVELHGVRAVFHRPHPSPVAKRSAVRGARDFLRAAGAAPDQERDDA